jgi:hypothetical protein
MALTMAGIMAYHQWHGWQLAMASWPALNNEMANINNGERNEISKIMASISAMKHRKRENGISVMKYQ